VTLLRGSLKEGFPYAAEIAEGVRQFNAAFGEMERALWCLSKAARADLLQRRSSPILEGLVWTIKSWWGVQGVHIRRGTEGGDDGRHTVTIRQDHRAI
jgi:hypothetical protein